MGIGRRQLENDLGSADGALTPIRVFWQVTNVLGTTLLVGMYGLIIAAVFWSLSSAAICARMGANAGYDVCEKYAAVNEPLPTGD